MTYPVYKLFTLNDGQTVLRVTDCKTMEERDRLMKEGYTTVDTVWFKVSE